MKEMSELRKAVLAVIDENSSPKELREQAALLDRVRTLCLAGAAPLDGSELIRGVSEFVRHNDLGRKPPTVEIHRMRDELTRGLLGAASFCRLRATASERRLAGAIADAQKLEDQAENEYRSLPPRWAW